MGEAVFQTKEISLPGFTRRVRIEQLSALESRRLARRIMNAAGNALSSASTAGDADEDYVAIAAILEHIDDETLDWLHQTFLPRTQVADQHGHFARATSEPMIEAELFDGGKGLLRWFAWLKACLEYTVGDFLGAAGALLPRRQAEATTQGTSHESPSQSPSPRAGFSIGSLRAKRTGDSPSSRSNTDGP